MFVFGRNLSEKNAEYFDRSESTEYREVEMFNVRFPSLSLEPEIERFMKSARFFPMFSESAPSRSVLDAEALADWMSRMLEDARITDERRIANRRKNAIENTIPARPCLPGE